jgi:hypothetical protein
MVEALTYYIKVLTCADQFMALCSVTSSLPAGDESVSLMTDDNVQNEGKLLSLWTT